MYRRMMIALSLAFAPLITPAEPLPEPQQSAAETQEHIKVELLVFRYTDNPTNPEQWAPPSLVNLANAIELVVPEFSIEQTQCNYCLLPRDQLTMANQATRLDNTDDIEVLLHVAWVQTMLDMWHSKPVHITGGDNYTIQGELANEVDGTIQVGKNKFLQFSANLNFTEPVDKIHFETKPRFSPYTQTPFALTYHLNQSRKMKMNELNYIDNPNFGMLVKISKITKPLAPMKEPLS